MPHALLLSPDDQAVSAITAVLEEMSVTCERPLDGVSAAQKLNAHSFDLVLVDCENLPAAKLIFDVCRRGKNGNNPVPIAIVDGRAGLPTAFRLGAELILTKPVAKDQARSTIRTAVSRLRKDVQTKESVPAQPASTAMPSAVTTSAVMSEERAQAAAAAAVSLQLTSFAEPAPSFVPTAAPSAVSSAASTATLSAPAVTMEMQSAVDEIDASPATPGSNPKSASFSASSSSESSSDRALSVNSKPARPVKPSDDPVLAELERTELAEAELAEAELAEAQLESSKLNKAAPDQPAAESRAPGLPSYHQGQRKRRSPLVALLMLALAGAGFYAAWTYQPGFRAIAQPQIDRVLTLAGMALPPTAEPNPAQPSIQRAPAIASAPASQSSTHPNRTQSTVPDSATSSATSSAAGSPAASAAAVAPLQPAATPGKAVTPPTSGATTAAAPVVTKPEASKPSDSKKGATAATSSDTQPTGENSAIILSSQGAEKRLAYSVPAKYPVEARSGEAQGTVVLKAVVDETGKVESLRLVEGDATLATAAINAVQQWRYRPYVRDGKAQPFQTVVIIDFQRP
ncbi:MAG TPA: TonB family protein [Terriglobales bacterium]|nr:TonB family protein [Terriglobales bacterium]